MKNNQTISKRGGKREGAGRKVGVPNKVGADLRELAQEYTSEALAALLEMVRGDNGAAKVAAAREILDRGHGKAIATIDANVKAEISGDWLYQIVNAAR